MNTYTSAAKLAKPAFQDRRYDLTVNANFDALDTMAALGGLCVTPAEIPSASLGIVVAPGSLIMLSGIPASFAGDVATVPASSVTMVWLTDGAGLATGPAWPSTPYVPLAVVTSDADSITSVADARVQCASLGAPALVPVMPKTAAYTLTDADGVIAADATGGAFTVTLLSAVGRPGRQFTVKRVSAANNVTVGTTGGQTIDGASTYVLTTQWAAVTLISNGTNWLIIGKV